MYTPNPIRQFTSLELARYVVKTLDSLSLVAPIQPRVKIRNSPKYVMTIPPASRPSPMDVDTSSFIVDTINDVVQNRTVSNYNDDEDVIVTHDQQMSEANLKKILEILQYRFDPNKQLDWDSIITHVTSFASTYHKLNGEKQELEQAITGYLAKINLTTDQNAQLTEEINHINKLKDGTIIMNNNMAATISDLEKKIDESKSELVDCTFQVANYKDELNKLQHVRDLSIEDLNKLNIIISFIQNGHSPLDEKKFSDKLQVLADSYNSLYESYSVLPKVSREFLEMLNKAVAIYKDKPMTDRQIMKLLITIISTALSGEDEELYNSYAANLSPVPTPHQADLDFMDSPITPDPQDRDDLNKLAAQLYTKPQVLDAIAQEVESHAGYVTSDSDSAFMTYYDVNSPVENELSVMDNHSETGSTDSNIVHSPRAQPATTKKANVINKLPSKNNTVVKKARSGPYNKHHQSHKQ